MIFTFYSFKGGVGRSMALANIAELFYQDERNVIMVDWDLEAPGLEQYFSDGLNLAETLEHPGLIDMLVDYKQRMARPQEFTADNLPFPDPEQYLVEIKRNGNNRGRLRLLPAGQRGGAFAAYGDAVQSFDWADFYRNWEGELYFDWLREKLDSMAEVVLIDSRTGVTEIGGICTYQMADIIVMFCAPSQQNIDGTLQMAQNFTRPEVQQRRGDRHLDILIIPARLDTGESTEINIFQVEFARTFQTFMSREKDLLKFFSDMGIPYIPKYAFKEFVAVREGVVYTAANMAAAFRRIYEKLNLYTKERVRVLRKQAQLLQHQLSELELKQRKQGTIGSAGRAEIEVLRNRLSQLQAQIRTSAANRRGQLEPEATAVQATQLMLRFEPGKGELVQIIWESDVLGRFISTFRPPYDSRTLPLVMRALDASQSGQDFASRQFTEDERAQLSAMGMWLHNKPVADLPKRVGRALYDSLVADRNSMTALSTVRNSATSQGQPISYILRFPPDAAAYAALPWELLWDQTSALLLSRGKQSELVRYLDLDQALPPPLPTGRRLRILALAPQAGIKASTREGEYAARQEAWAALTKDNLVEIEELRPVTAAALVDRIQSGPPIDIVHFYGHGRYEDGQGALLFDAAHGHSWIDADRLATLLGETRMIMLHASQSAIIGETGLLTGVAPALSAAGVPIVVAIQLTVRANAATRFAEVVYRGLARGDSVQRAVAQARQALYVEEEDGVSWYVPTLTIRTRNTGLLYMIRPS